MSPAPIETEDLILLKSLDHKFDDLKTELNETRKRLQRIERAHPGGRWGKIVERGILLALTSMLGWQNIGDYSRGQVRGAVQLEAPRIDRSAVSTSTVHH